MKKVTLIKGYYVTEDQLGLKCCALTVGMFLDPKNKIPSKCSEWPSGSDLKKYWVKKKHKSLDWVESFIAGFDIYGLKEKTQWENTFGKRSKAHLKGFRAGLKLNILYFGPLKES